MAMKFRNLFLKTIFSWFLICIIAVINGIIRNLLYQPSLGDHLAHQISTFILIILIFLFSYYFWRRDIRQLSSRQLLFIGLIWLILTEAFEFLAGHYLFGNPWNKILADYNILAGRLWLLVIITTFIAPYLIGVMLKKSDV